MSGSDSGLIYQNRVFFDSFFFNQNSKANSERNW